MRTYCNITGPQWTEVLKISSLCVEALNSYLTCTLYLSNLNVS